MRRATICWRSLTGSEGLLAVTTEVTVKLLPKPVKAQVVLAAFDSVLKAGDAVANIIAAGMHPGRPGDDGQARHRRQSSSSCMPAIRWTRPRSCCANRDGTEEEVAAEIEKVSQVMRASGAIEIRLSRDEAERLKFWSGRKSAFPAVGRILPDYYCMDGTIPTQAAGRGAQRASAELSKEFGLSCPNVFHAGDGNLHPLIMFDANDDDQLQRADALRLAHPEAVHRGGRHHHRRARRRHREDQRDVRAVPPRRAQLPFTPSKRAFDQHGLLNPGKAVPTLHRCAEFGSMHVHRGQEKFPELPRF